MCVNRDVVNESRYFAYHNTGLHAVSVEFIQQLQRFLESEGSYNCLNCFTGDLYLLYFR